MDNAIIAAGAILHYLTTAEHHHTSHLTSIKRIDRKSHLWMDDFTIANLELIYSYNNNGHTLVEVLDKTSTAMGGRLLKKWLLFPLISSKKINDRLEMVDYLIKNEKFINSSKIIFMKLEI